MSQVLFHHVVLARPEFESQLEVTIRVLELLLRHPACSAISCHFLVDFKSDFKLSFW